MFCFGFFNEVRGRLKGTEEIKSGLGLVKSKMNILAQFSVTRQLQNVTVKQGNGNK